MADGYDDVTTKGGALVIACPRVRVAARANAASGFGAAEARACLSTPAPL
jgi:hypothetical protein